MAPEIGLLYPVGVGAGYVTLSARYHWTTNSDDLNYQGFNFSIGFAGVSF